MRYVLIIFICCAFVVTPAQAKGKNKNKSKSSGNADVYRKRLIIAKEKLAEYQAELSQLEFETAKKQLQERIDSLKQAIRRYELRLKGSSSSKSKKKK